MKIIVDWDNTLFDTPRMRSVTFNLLRKHNVNINDWKKSWSQAFGNNYLGKFFYTIKEHARRYAKIKQFNVKKFLSEYVQTHQSIQYLYNDTLNFLKKARKFGKLELVTYGDKRFQEWKVDMSYARAHFDAVRVVPTAKAGQLHKILSKDDINIFLDDNAKEIDEAKRFFPQIVAIHIRRPKSWHAKEKSSRRDYEVKNLNQALMIIRHLKNKITTSVDEAVRALKLGKAVVYPTDTAYGLGVDATNPQAVAKLWRIKERGDKPIHLIVSDLKMARRYAIIDAWSEKLFRRLTPGPITIVLPLRPLLNLPLMRGRKRGGHSNSWLKLSAGTGTIGIRIPDNKIALRLVKKLGRPITTTSANPSHRITGGTTPYSLEHSFKQFRGTKYQPDLYLDGGVLPKRKTSTIVSVSGGRIKIFREGPISTKQIAKAIK